ncbi:peptidoglycan bridge formation glycyltransferase FemA/FemB family protein [Natrinema marinum]|uniref:peptidoglycan bridge formation glycyltransferase FemA/FemB family protein n=1 Tax=Natrinema marinum TaxID=2961598 RepID=UPI0020C868EB|nr:peptidoglycan bridge formation glycyltransferase FemA/FemB family protein [Natrinema marinum]
MSLTVRQLDTIETANENQWDEVVSQAELGSVFHRYDWLRAVERGRSFDPRHLVVEKKGNPIAVWPNFVASVGPTPLRRLNTVKPGSVGPIAMTDEEAAIERLLEAVPVLCDGRVLFNQISIVDPDYVRYHDVLSEHGYELRIENCHLRLDITHDWDEIIAEMDSSRRRAIRRGHDHDGTVVDEALTPELLADVHRSYESVIDRLEGWRLPASFFRELEHVPELVKVFSLYVDGKRRGSMVFVLDDERSTIQYLCSAVTEDDFEYNASELIHEHAIKWGMENGYETYNFRGTDPDFRDGLFRFKERFAADPVPCLTWERGYPKPALTGLNAGRTLYQWYTS